jgi:hypothetical protein
LREREAVSPEGTGILIRSISQNGDEERAEECECVMSRTVYILE